MGTPMAMRNTNSPAHRFQKGLLLAARMLVRHPLNMAHFATDSEACVAHALLAHGYSPFLRVKRALGGFVGLRKGWWRVTRWGRTPTYQSAGFTA